jgi:hypothetical protein
MLIVDVPAFKVKLSATTPQSELTFTVEEPRFKVLIGAGFGVELNAHTLNVLSFVFSVPLLSLIVLHEP